MVRKLLLTLFLVSFITSTAHAALFGQPSPWKRTGTVISPVVSTDTVTGNGAVPQGVIAIWSGSIATIPTGWELSDGTCAITCPDLRNVFVVGANADVAGVAKSTVKGAAAQTGGSVTMTEGNLPSTLQVPAKGTVSALGGSAGAQWRIDSTANGVASNSDAFVPPFYALAYIIKD